MFPHLSWRKPTASRQSLRNGLIGTLIIGYEIFVVA
jgi:hypothetical protein